MIAKDRYSYSKPMLPGKRGDILLCISCMLPMLPMDKIDGMLNFCPICNQEPILIGKNGSILYAVRNELENRIEYVSS